MSKEDIKTRAEIRNLVDRFYDKLLVDPLIKHFFVDLDLEHHLPRVAMFWEMVLLGDAGYTTNVTDVHLRLNQQKPMSKEHFDRWLVHFEATMNELHEGPKAEEAIPRARSIAIIMHIKVEVNN